MSPVWPSLCLFLMQSADSQGNTCKDDICLCGIQMTVSFSEFFALQLNKVLIDEWICTGLKHRFEDRNQFISFVAFFFSVHIRQIAWYQNEWITETIFLVNSFLLNELINCLKNTNQWLRTHQCVSLHVPNVYLHDDHIEIH